MPHLAPLPALADPLPLSPEARLLLACMRWPRTRETAPSLPQITSASPDWQEFLALAEHHRVVPLVHRALSAHPAAIPPQMAEALKTAAAENARSVLTWLTLVRDLSALLHRAAIPVRVLKGVPLSLAAYADPSLRDVGDLDLLIPPEAAETADRLLLEHGWARKHPAARLTPRRLQTYLRNEKDFTYGPGPSGFECDLHWRLFRNPRMPGNALAAADASREITLGGITLHTLPQPHAFLHLCVHGALDRWYRLKGLADIAALWTGFAQADRQSLIALARTQAILPEFAAALLLARRLTLLDAEDTGPSLDLLENDPVVVHIMGHAMHGLLRHGFRPASAQGGSWALKRYELGLRPRLSYRSAILRRVLFRARVWERFSLPDPLHFLYPLLSPIEWLLFKLRRPSYPDPRNTAPVPARAKTGTVGRLWTRWRQLRWPDRLLLAEAGFCLLAARILLKLLPARLVLGWIQSGSARSQVHLDGRPERDPRALLQIRWAVLVAARHAPLSFVCFPQALAGLAMLRRRGLAGELVYGVRRSADGRLRAHTWLRSGGQTILGGETSPLFTPIAAWTADH